MSLNRKPGFALPPPGTFDLTEGNLRIGHVRGDVVSFHGFRDEHEAGYAAWLAYRSMIRRLARRAPAGVVPEEPVDSQALVLERGDDHCVVLAGEQPIASLRRHPDHDPGAGVSFEIRVPPPNDEISMQATAYRMQYSLRRSGLTWPRTAAELSATLT